MIIETKCTLGDNPHPPSKDSSRSQTPPKMRNPCHNGDATRSPIFWHVGNYLGKLLQDEFNRKIRHLTLKDIDEHTVSLEFKSQFIVFT